MISKLKKTYFLPGTYYKSAFGGKFAAFLFEKKYRSIDKEYATIVFPRIHINNTQMHIALEELTRNKKVLEAIDLTREVHKKQLRMNGVTYTQGHVYPVVCYLIENTEYKD